MRPGGLTYFLFLKCPRITYTAVPGAASATDTVGDAAGPVEQYVSIVTLGFLEWTALIHHGVP